MRARRGIGLVPSPLRAGRTTDWASRCSGRRRLRHLSPRHRTPRRAPRRAGRPLIPGGRTAIRPRRRGTGSSTARPAGLLTPTGCSARRRCPHRVSRLAGPSRLAGLSRLAGRSRPANVCRRPEISVRTLRPPRLIAPSSGRSTARRRRQCRGWLGVLPQNGARQKQRCAVTPRSASAEERAEV